eukprot:4595554-Pleurochrysis_carterae.AAC.1
MLDSAVRQTVPSAPSLPSTALSDGPGRSGVSTVAVLEKPGRSANGSTVSRRPLEMTMTIICVPLFLLPS